MEFTPTPWISPEFTLLPGSAQSIMGLHSCKQPGVIAGIRQDLLNALYISIVHRVHGTRNRYVIIFLYILCYFFSIWFSMY